MHEDSGMAVVLCVEDEESGAVFMPRAFGEVVRGLKGRRL